MADGLAMAEQRTAEWFAARIGKATGSRIADVVKRQKNGKPYAAYEDYLGEIVCERLTGEMNEHFISPAMQRGTDLEPEARTRYEVETGFLVVETGFCQHPEIEMSGGSPDGLVDEDGIIEIKCPNTINHIKNLQRNAPDPRYWEQMQWNMECTGRDWCDFVSYDDRLPLELQIVVYRVERDDAFLVLARERVLEFLAEVDRAVADLKERMNG